MYVLQNRTQRYNFSRIYANIYNKITIFLQKTPIFTHLYSRLSVEPSAYMPAAFVKKHPFVMKNALDTLFSLKKFVYLKKKHYLCTLFMDGISA